VAIQRRALVLNQNYEPLNVCSVRRAVVLVFRGKAEILEIGEEPLHGVGEARFDTPSVIRLQHFVRRPMPQPRLTRREIFARDGNHCQYCGRRSELTLDHVVPRHRGGPHTWENLVTACRSCNHRKGGRTPDEASMTLTRRPRRPSSHPAELFALHLQRYQEWTPFITGWRRDPSPASVSTAVAS
jgi:5-methylcytosine-specific restriction endonuclease McrA